MVVARLQYKVIEGRFKKMPQTITQTSTTLSNQLQVPLNNVDFVDDLTVKGPFQTLLNNDYRLARAAFSTVPNISMSSFNGTTITVDPFTDLLLAESNTTITTSNLLYGQSIGATLSTSNLDTGVAFAADSLYYVYAIYGVANCTFEISLVAPDANKQFKTGNITRRFIGIFLTSIGAAIFPFSKIGNSYLCNDINQLALNTSGMTVTATATYTLPSFFKRAIIKISVTTAEIASSSFSIKPGNGAATAYLYRFSMPVANTFWFVEQVTPISLINGIYTITLNSGGPANVDLYPVLIGWEI